MTTNVVSYTTTGKTNADHVISFVTGKDCKVFRVTLNEEICDQNDSRMALKKETIEEKNKTNKPKSEKNSLQNKSKSNCN